MVFLYLPAGQVNENTLDQAADVLDPGDVLVDGGNSYWGDSLRRHARLAGRGLRFVDLGTSGGLAGARHGACFDDGTILDCDLVVVGIGVRPNTALAEQAGIATDNGVSVDEFLETNVPGIFAAGDIARWPDPRAGRIRVEHWVVAQRQGQAAARNMLGARVRFAMVPFFWSNHYDLHVHYVGHGSGDGSISGNLKARDASVMFRDGEKLTAVASIGRDVENLTAEVALERGAEH